MHSAHRRDSCIVATMVVNSIGSAIPRGSVERSQLAQNRWNPYTSGGLEPTMPLAPGYGSPYDIPPGASFYAGHPMHHPVHSLVAAGDGSQGYGMKFSSSADGYGASAHGSSGGYDYHPPPPPHPPPHPAPPPSIIHSLPPLWPSSSHHGKSGKGKGAALSALTLLAFLYFLNLLQSCLKEHMETMNPTVMVMTAGATRRKDIATSLEQSSSSVEDAPREESYSDGPDVDAIDRYEGLSHRYQLLTSSNGTRNPFAAQPKRSNRPTATQTRKKQSSSTVYSVKRNRPPTQHTGSDWYDRS
ncbi:uncharacterized protein LOC126565577 [Anopheles maculipalpis]|uniref:uncharacterized protein LOC126565577 n=1 Tax=Anopheles maculipalpis TaxID=1496333 RepID=UPI002158DE32|nr:uncharacterized protein LOC126565577 [Anopheles maculipalpis]